MRSFIGATVATLLAVASSQQAFAQSDVEVLQFALALERLEVAFYEEGIPFLEEHLNSTDGGNGTVVTEQMIARFTEISEHEEDHVDALESAIEELNGTVPEDECEYEFSYETPEEFINIARLLENIGVSAYLGGAYYLSGKELLTAAATIATVEARHAAWLNQINDLSPFPTAFDSPLDAASVITLVQGYLGPNCSLPITPNPNIETTSLLVPIGGTVNITTDALDGPGSGDGNETIYCVFYTSSASTNSTLEWDEGGGGNGTATWFCRVPDDALAGDNYLFLSTQGTYQVNHPEWVIAGPTIVNIEEGEGIPEPTESPSEEPTETPSEEPTEVPTSSEPEPTSEPTIEPTSGA